MEGVRVFVPDTEHVWLPAVITQSSSQGKRLTVRLEKVAGPRDAAVLQAEPVEKELEGVAGSEREVALDDPLVVKALASRHMSVSNTGSTGGAMAAATATTRAGTGSLPLQNTSESSKSAAGFEDMITIDHLHEASILHNLRRRFFQKLPYTYTGKICIAVNPYQWLNLYDTAIMAQFRDGKRDGKAPHVYAVSMEAFYNMRDKGEDQSILVSGESGAGKTETTKIVMSHLASLAENSNSKVIQQIIQANPLLESFGNAKTVRNDNSSRFGKFTELQFGQDSKLIGAFSRTYLLEKSRVTTQADGERNFHIFYQLLKKKDQFPQLNLQAVTNNGRTFRYIAGNNSSPTSSSPSSPTLQENIDEEGDLTKTCEALELIGIGSDLQTEIFQILAGILHLGETSFCVRNGDVDASQIVDMEPFETVCTLLGVQVAALERALCNRNVHVGREVILKPMTRDQASDCRDALAKSLYSKLFLWLVEQINETIGVQTSKSASGGRGCASFIGILDIFGFEHFEKNSFEQFCINYANEKLQQKFVQDVLKTVQLEYEEENITWSHITFADNQDVLNLIEGRLGVISFLNEESLLVTGTDAAFASKLGAVMENNPLLETPRLNQCAFTIFHYAGKVTYDANGFLDKHRDAILPDIKQCMSTSTLKILSKTFEADAAASTTGGNGPSGSLSRTMSRKKLGQAQPKRSTVGSQFKDSLSQLMDKINLTDVHYVRCLKPNSGKSANAFSHGEIVSQLRCAGVIEAIRVSRSAYPSRIPHAECLKKFTMLGATATMAQAPLPSLLDASDSDSDLVRTQCDELMALLLPGKNIQDYQVGLTRVYFRESVLETLESMRAQALRKYVILLQTNVRCFLMRRKFQKIRKSAIVIQQYWRRHVAQKRFLKAKRGVIQLQARVRGQKARQGFRKLKLAHYIVRFQAICRAFVQRRKYLKILKAVRKIQSFTRVTLLRMVFLKKMAKEKKTQALGLKVARLQEKLDKKQTTSATSSATGTKASPSAVAGKMRGSISQADGSSGSFSSSLAGAGGRSSLLVNNSRYSGASSAGILDESQEVITALHEENEKLRAQLDAQEENVQKLKTELRTLKQWQKSKEVDEKVLKIAHRDQESKDLTFLYALETEYEKLRAFVCENMGLPLETGSIAAPALATVATPPAGGGGGAGGSSPPPANRPQFVPQVSERTISVISAKAARESGHPEQKVHEAHQVLVKSAARLTSARAKTSTNKGSARRVKDHWEEIRNYPPAMHYSIGSVPWKRLLTDWAQGNPKKLDYMTRWLKNVLDGGPIVSDTFPMGVELKYVTPMMLDGFMQLVIPKLAERPDVQVHVHTKEFIGTSMRITLSENDPAGGGTKSSGLQRGNSHFGSGSTSSGSRAPEHDDYRLSMLANASPMLANNSSSRYSQASTSSSSLSSGDQQQPTNASHYHQQQQQQQQVQQQQQQRPSGGGFFRSSRTSNPNDTTRGSFFQSRK